MKNNCPRIFLIAKFGTKTKTLKFGTESTLFGYFWTEIWRWYYHIWSTPSNLSKVFFFLIHMVNFVIGIRPRCTDLLLTNSQSTFKETYRKNTPSNKTGALTKSMNIYIWVICILNQLFIRDYYTQIEFLRKWSSQWQKPILCDVVYFIPPFNMSLH